MRAITDRAFGLYRRRNKCLRPEQLLQIEQAWRVIPSLDCSGLSIVRDRKNMIINDIRLSGAICTNSMWEPGATKAAIYLIQSTMSLTKLTAAITTSTLAAISLHALARWYERSRPQSDAGLMQDLTILAAAAPAVLASGQPTFLIPTPHCGKWLGSADAMSTGERLCNVRTFSPND